MAWKDLAQDIAEEFSDTENISYLERENFQVLFPDDVLIPLLRRQHAPPELPKLPRPFSCKLCDASFGSWYGLSGHIAYWHEGPPKKRYDPSAPTKSGLSREEYQKEQARRYDARYAEKWKKRKYPFPCEACGLSYGTFRGLYVHASATGHMMPRILQVRAEAVHHCVPWMRYCEPIFRRS